MKNIFEERTQRIQRRRTRSAERILADADMSDAEELQEKTQAKRLKQDRAFVAEIDDRSRQALSAEQREEWMRSAQSCWEMTPRTVSRRMPGPMLFWPGESW